MDADEERELNRELEEQGRELLRLAAEQQQAKLAQRLAQRAAEPRVRQAAFHPATGRPAGSWEVLADAVERADIVEASDAYIGATAALPPEQSSYGGVEWSATRTYADEGHPPSPQAAELLGPVFEPLIAAVQLQLEGRCACALKLESAFATLYTADSNRGMSDHRDFDCNGRLVACSAILQGHTASEFEGGGLLMRADPDGSSGESEGGVERTLVALEPGDLLLLFGAWHEPRDISSGTRLVFVFFFHETVVRMTMDGASALDEARAAADARREKLGSPAIALPPDEWATPPASDASSFVVEPELEPEPEPELGLPLSRDGDSGEESNRGDTVGRRESGSMAAPPPVVLGGSTSVDGSLNSKTLVRQAAHSARLAARLELKRQAAVEREQVEAAAGWLRREPAMLPSLMQTAWEWDQEQRERERQ